MTKLLQRILFLFLLYAAVNGGITAKENLEYNNYLKDYKKVDDDAVKIPVKNDVESGVSNGKNQGENEDGTRLLVNTLRRRMKVKNYDGKMKGHALILNDRKIGRPVGRIGFGTILGMVSALTSIFSLTKRIKSKHSRSGFLPRPLRLRARSLRRIQF